MREEIEEGYGAGGGRGGEKGMNSGEAEIGDERIR